LSFSCAVLLGHLPSSQGAALEALPGWCWNLHEQTWAEGYRHLEEYVAQNGHANVPYRFACEDGYPLGHWVELQKQSYLKRQMPAGRRSLLEQMPGWQQLILRAALTKSIQHRRWLILLEHLQEFVVRHGHTRVPCAKRLGRWVSAQRCLRKKGRLVDWKCQMIERIPGWTWEREKVESGSWKHQYTRLLEYTKYHGTARIPVSYVTPDGFRLGRWTFSQRRLYRLQKMSAIKTTALEGLPGWRWNPKSGVPGQRFWEKGLECLRQYVAGLGTARVLASHVAEDGFRLGVWVCRQRGLRRMNKLTPEEVATLEAMPGWVWDPPTPNPAYRNRAAQIAR
jgi:hypothetical protein